MSIRGTLHLLLPSKRDYWVATTSPLPNRWQVENVRTGEVYKGEHPPYYTMTEQAAIRIAEYLNRRG